MYPRTIYPTREKTSIEETTSLVEREVTADKHRSFSETISGKLPFISPAQITPLYTPELQDEANCYQVLSVIQ